MIKVNKIRKIGGKYLFKVNNKDTIKTSMDVVLVPLLLILSRCLRIGSRVTREIYSSFVSVVDF